MKPATPTARRDDDGALRRTVHPTFGAASEHDQPREKARTEQMATH
jgi:hypothetical protein